MHLQRDTALHARGICANTKYHLDVNEIQNTLEHSIQWILIDGKYSKSGSTNNKHLDMVDNGALTEFREVAASSGEPQHDGRY
jgi:hypothetical protein